MLLASLVAITRNGCARSAFQPRLAGVFAFWVRTKPCPFFCRSSEMLLASLAAITRNGCARSAFQPRLAGVFAFWVRTKTCPLFCRSSEMLLASLAAITRNGCARSAFQPRLAGVFAFWVRTKTCPLFLRVVGNGAGVSRGYHKKWLCAIGIPAASGRGVRFLGADQNLSAFSAGRLKCGSRLSRLSQEMAVRDRHSSRIWPGCSLSGCGPKPVRFFLPVVGNAARVSRGYHKKWLCAIGIPAASGRGVRFLGADQNLSAFSAGRLKCCSRLSRLSQEMAVRDRHSSRIWPGCSLSGCGPKPVRFLLPVV